MHDTPIAKVSQCQKQKRVDNFDVQAFANKARSYVKTMTLAIERTENLNNTTQRCM